MLALDTNVLVRFLVRDDERQHKKAVRLIEQHVDSDEPLFVSDVVLCEVVWVLERLYKVPRDEIVGILAQLLHAKHLSFVDAGRLRRVGGQYLAPGSEVPPLIQLGALLQAADRIGRNEETAADLALILAPGSSLGGARPKASVVDQHGQLSIAKFPRHDDEYSIELWEWIALQLARAAGIRVAHAQLLPVARREVLLSRRFDRQGDERIHFASALTLLGLKDGDQASYPEIAEVLQRDGSQPRKDCEELFRRMVFNIAIANVDDHLRNHGFLREPGGWALSPAYDLNPVPADLRPRILSTNVTPDDATGSLDAARESASYFGLAPNQANAIITQVLAAVATWQAVARTSGASVKECARMKSAFL